MSIPRTGQLSAAKFKDTKKSAVINVVWGSSQQRVTSEQLASL